MIVENASQVGNPIIRAKARPHVKPVSKESRKIVADLIDSMRHHELVGMAAPQIGKSVRIFVTEMRKTRFRKAPLDPVRVFINPRIRSRSKKLSKDWEGCGSVAASNLFAKVSRPTAVTVEAYTEKGEKFTLDATGLMARIIQHEMDHLDGKVFTDTADRGSYMSKSEYLKMRKRNKNK